MNAKETNPLLHARIEAERALIGCAFMAPAETRQTCGWLKPETFWLEQCGQFWQRFTAGEEAYSLALDMNLVADAARWGNDLPSVLYAGDYARKVAEGAYLDRLNRLSVQLAQATMRADAECAKLTQAEIAQLLPQAHAGAHNWFDVACNFIDLLGRDVRSVPTGLRLLDLATAGFERQTESLIAARPSQGKSTLALQIAMHAARQGQRVLFVSLEMSETNLFARAACPLVNLTWLDVRRGSLTAEQREALETAAAQMGSEYAPNLYVYDKRATTETVWELAVTHHADLVFVDHLRKLGDNPDMPEVKRLGHITNRLKQMAKELNLHVCVLVQLNRGADGEPNSAPEMKHIRDSGEVEEDADLIMVLHGLPVADRDKSKPTRDVDLWIRKARDGEKDAKIELRFHLKLQRFAGRQDGNY